MPRSTRRPQAQARTRRDVDWPVVAARLAREIPRTALHPVATSWAEGRTSAARGPWGVAVSGGSDSVALLLLLWAHWPARRASLRVLHFNHRLRGRAADADEIFCRRIAGALGVRFESGRWARPPRGATEATARAARFDFFERRLRRERSRVLWLGHQRDDIAETMLMRLARGSGSTGLAAPRPLQSFPDGRCHLRPLLTLSRARLAAGLRRAGGVWREDASNLGPSFLRNRIRNRVLPAWARAEAPRDPAAGAALAREILEEDSTALDQWTTETRALRPGRVLDLRRLGSTPRAIWRRALHRWIAGGPVRVDVSRQAFESLLAAAMAGQTTRRSLGKGLLAAVEDGRLRWVRDLPQPRRKTSRKSGSAPIDL